MRVHNVFLRDRAYAGQNIRRLQTYIQFSCMNCCSFWGNVPEVAKKLARDPIRPRRPLGLAMSVYAARKGFFPFNGAPLHVCVCMLMSLAKVVRVREGAVRKMLVALGKRLHTVKPRARDILPEDVMCFVVHERLELVLVDHLRNRLTCSAPRDKRLRSRGDCNI